MEYRGIGEPHYRRSPCTWILAESAKLRINLHILSVLGSNLCICKIRTPRGSVSQGIAVLILISQDLVISVKSLTVRAHLLTILLVALLLFLSPQVHASAK